MVWQLLSAALTLVTAGRAGPRGASKQGGQHAARHCPGRPGLRGCTRPALCVMGHKAEGQLSFPRLSSRPPKVPGNTAVSEVTARATPTGPKSQGLERKNKLTIKSYLLAGRFIRGILTFSGSTTIMVSTEHSEGH